MNEATDGQSSGSANSRMNGATTSRAENREQWQGLVAEQRASGESMRAFCRGRGVSYPRFLAWVKRLAPNGEGARSGGFAPNDHPRSADAFCEVRVGAPVFEIASGGVVVRLASGFGEGLQRRFCFARRVSI